MEGHSAVFVDRQSARFGLLGMLASGFGLGILWAELWVPAAFFLVCGAYSMYRSHGAEVRTVSEESGQDE